MNSSIDGIGLSSLIAAVRGELEAAELSRTARGASPLLELKSIDIEIHFTVEKSTAGKGGVDLKVVAIGRETCHTREEIHKVKAVFGVDGEASASGRLRYSDTADPHSGDVEPLGD